MILQAFTITQTLSTDIADVRYWDVASVRMQGLSVEALLHGVDHEDWLPVLDWDHDFGVWRDYSDGATFSDLDFDHPSGIPSNAVMGNVRSDWHTIWRTPLDQRKPIFTTQIEYV